METINASFNQLYSNYKRKALKRKLDFNLSKEQFKYLTSAPCFYCGIIPMQVYVHHKSKNPYTYNGIDRKNNLESYTQENCVACCKFCNYAKNIMSEDEFRLWIKLVYNNYVVKNEIQ